MMSVSSGRNRFPFTATQWEELEHQALIFKYMVSGMPIPPDLLFTVKRSFDSSSLPSKLILQPQHVGWNCFQMGFGRKIDPEPGRCRRTDGKKWRCSKEAYPDSKYCERHMHRGRNRSRKPVEVNNMTTTNTTITSSSNSNPKTSQTSNNTIPISSITRNYTNPSNFPQSNPISSSSTAHFLSPLSSMHSGSESDSQHNHHPCFNNHNISSGGNGTTTTTTAPLHHPFLYPHSSSSSRPPGIGLSSQDNNTHFLMDSSPYSHSDKDYRYSQENSGTMKSSMSGSSVGDSWHLEPLTMSSSSIMAHQKQRNPSSVLQQSPYSSCSSSSYLQLSDTSKQDQQNYYLMGSNRASGLKCEMPFNSNRDDVEPQKVMHHFFDEWPPKNEDSTTQLSISIPTTDFFMSHNDK